MAPRDRLELIRARDLVLGTFLERLARVHGSHAGGRLVEEADDGLRLTYDEAADRVARHAGGIRPRIRAGERVVVATANGYELFLLSLAVCRAGGIAVPVNPKMRQDEIDHVFSDCGAVLLVRDAKEVEGDPVEAEPAEPEDVAALFYTSGTTGKPKGAQLSHRALLGGAGAMAAYPAWLRRDEAVSGMPVAHVAGFTMLISLVALGVPVYLLRRFRPDECLDAIESRRASVFIGVPAMYRMMLEAGAEERDLRSVRIWASGADLMPVDLARRFQRMGAALTIPLAGRSVGQATFLDGYGMVELGGGAAVKVLPPASRLPGSGQLAIPLPGFRMKVVDDEGRAVTPGQVGELVVKGPGVMRGYHGHDDATRDALTADGWLRTGDLARRRTFGLIELAGRKKDVIKHGGYSVFAAEVEQALAEHPAVLEAAVVGLPDERKGEVPAAVVCLRPGTRLSEDELVQWAKEHLSDYKVPQQVRFADSLPRTGTEKVQKADLRDLFAEPGTGAARVSGT